MKLLTQSAEKKVDLATENIAQVFSDRSSILSGPVAIRSHADVVDRYVQGLRSVESEVGCPRLQRPTVA